MENILNKTRLILGIVGFLFFQIFGMSHSDQFGGEKLVKLVDEQTGFFNETNRLPREMIQEIVKRSDSSTVHALLLLSKKHYAQIVSWSPRMFPFSMKKIVKRYIKKKVHFFPLLAHIPLQKDTGFNKKNNTVQTDSQESNTKSYHSTEIVTQSYHSDTSIAVPLIKKKSVHGDLVDKNEVFCNKENIVQIDSQEENTKSYHSTEIMTQSYHSDTAIPYVKKTKKIIINGDLVEVDESLFDNVLPEQSEIMFEHDISGGKTSDISTEFDTTFFTNIIQKYQIPSDGIKTYYDIFPKKFRILFSGVAHKIADNGMLRLYHTIDDAVKSGYLCTITSWKFYTLLCDSYKTQDTDIKIIDLYIHDNNNYLITGSCRYAHEQKDTSFIFCSGNDEKFLSHAIKNIMSSREEKTSNFDNKIELIISSDNSTFLKTFFTAFSDEQKKQFIRITIQGEGKECVFDDACSLLLQGYKNIKSLQCSNVQLFKVPDCVKHLSQLKKIYLDGNKIEHITTDEFPDKIKMIDLQGNPIVTNLGSFIIAMTSKNPSIILKFGKVCNRNRVKEFLPESSS